MQTKDLKLAFNWLVKELIPTDIQRETYSVRDNYHYGKRRRYTTIRCKVKDVTAGTMYTINNMLIKVNIRDKKAFISGRDFDYEFPTHMVLTIRHRLKIR